MEQLDFPFVKEEDKNRPSEVIASRLEAMAQKLEDWGDKESANDLWAKAFAIREGAA
jgi:hypothetical protein